MYNERGRDSDMLLSDNICKKICAFFLQRELDSHFNSQHLWSVQTSGDFKIYFNQFSTFLELFYSMIIFIISRAKWSWNKLYPFGFRHISIHRQTQTFRHTTPPHQSFADSGNFPGPDQARSLVAVLATALPVSSLQLILSDHRYGHSQQWPFFYIF